MIEAAALSAAFSLSSSFQQLQQKISELFSVLLYEKI